MAKKSKEPTKGTKCITFLPLKKACWFSGMPSILEVALANDIPINHSCGGMGSCTTCRIHVKKGQEKLVPPDEVELEHVQMRGWKPHERLACQTTAENGVEVFIPGEPVLDIKGDS